MHQTPVLRIPAVDLLAQADSAQDYPELTGNWSTPVVRAGGTTGFVSPGDFAVRKMHIFQMSEVQIVRVLAVVHVALDINDNRVFKCGGVVILLVAITRVSIPLNNDFSHTFTGGQCGKQKRRRLVKDLGNAHGLVYPLTGWLTLLGIAWNDDIVGKTLNHYLVFMPFLISIAH